ncbi:MAG: cytochrome c oxidase assembly protein [Paracoccaceae bacterium]|jgi:cytochrome c oxidase assembly protein subunit 11|nr:cytochrome c oxidase assembly protein [Paracoccaceae bacterium]MDG1372656.1 cytochrome c oxidase assembly protein [Paracoccaceae bacterium]
MTERDNNKTLIKLVGVVCVMVSLSFASVPLYDWFCRVTGYGGTTSVADGGSDLVLDREVTIRFASATERGMPWQFKPVATTMKVKIGETGLAFYEASNPTDRTVAGSASFNVTPFTAGGYFSKIDCFCFEEQVLVPGETVQMPVTFFVDPEIVEDDEAKLIHTITLSYTFHEIDIPEEDAAVLPLDENKGVVN